MKKIFSLLLAIAMIVCLSACSNAESNKPQETTSETIEVKKTTFSNELLDIPEAYYEKAESSTPSELFRYKHNDHEKSAVVYLPPNYNENEKYNVLYMLGGVHSNQTAFFNNAGEESTFKNILDNMINNGDIEPMICVNMLFYPVDGMEIGDMPMSEMTDDFCEEVSDIIIPQIETKYSTYSRSPAKTDLVNAREHRGFAGFSMGGATTWVNLYKSLEFFYYFAPEAAGSFEDYNHDIKKGVGDNLRDRMSELGYTKNDFFIYCCDGTEDVTYENMTKLINRFKDDFSDIFTFTDNDKAQGNITFKIKPNAKHEYANAYQYFYNAILSFWQK